MARSVSGSVLEVIGQLRIQFWANKPAVFSMSDSVRSYYLTMSNIQARSAHLTGVPGRRSLDTLPTVPGRPARERYRPVLGRPA